MHKDITPGQASNAMPVLTRRAMMMSAAGVVASPVSASSGADSPLLWLIDEHDELRAAFDKVVTDIEALLGRSDKPAWPEVSLTEIDARLYSVVWHRGRFLSLSNIDRFFLDFPDKRWWDEERVAAHFDNHQKARSLFIEREAAVTTWKEATGLRALCDKDAELLELMDALDARIVAFPCTTYDEVVAKVSWIEREFGAEISQERAVRILRSLAGINAGANSEVM